MTLIIKKPTIGNLVMRRTWQPMDPDAATYIAAVEAADGQALEEKTKIAIDNFVLGCKADGIWSAIKASCILAGARTLAGALVPLVGAAPTNNGPFVQLDYNRKTGLVGNGSTKYLNANIIDSSIPQNSSHLSIYGTNLQDGTYSSPWIGAEQSSESRVTALYGFASVDVAFNRSSDGAFVGLTRSSSKAFVGTSRSNSSSVIIRSRRTNIEVSSTSVTPSTASHCVFTAGRGDGTTRGLDNSRHAFYSIGEALDLAKLDARVTDLINAIGAAF